MAVKRSFDFFILLPWALVLILLVFIFLNKAPFHRSVKNPNNSAESRDFMFEINNFYTKNQGGQTVNMYFHYRYNDGIQTADIPDYRELRNDVLDYMNNLNISEEPYWETLTKTVCENLKNKYPIEAISCQFQVATDTHSGLPNEPGTHSSITTIGNIEPLAVIKF